VAKIWCGSKRGCWEKEGHRHQWMFKSFMARPLRNEADAASLKVLEERKGGGRGSVLSPAQKGWPEARNGSGQWPAGSVKCRERRKALWASVGPKGRVGLLLLRKEKEFLGGLL
jgi:hypothetical protein